MALNGSAQLETKAADIFPQEPGEAGVLAKFQPKYRRLDSHCTAGNLHDSAAKDLVFTQSSRPSHKTFMSDDSIFNGFSLCGDADRRGHSTIHEVCIVDAIVSVVEDFPLSQLNKCEMPVNVLELKFRQG
jgi:hypothetical protein